MVPASRYAAIGTGDGWMYRLRISEGVGMFWDDLVRRWRRDVRAVDSRLLRAAGGHVAVLPAPRRRRRSRVLWLIVIAVIIAIGVMLLQGGQVQALTAIVP
jgi:hypothetical protein